MRVFVTGSSGLIGSTAVLHWDKLGADVIGVDNDMRQLIVEVERLQKMISGQRVLIDELYAENERLKAAEQLWNTAVEEEGTDWANGILEAWEDKRRAKEKPAGAG